MLIKVLSVKLALVLQLCLVAAATTSDQILLEGYDDLRMSSGKQASAEQQEHINKMFDKLKDEFEAESVATLKASKAAEWNKAAWIGGTSQQSYEMSQQSEAALETFAKIIKSEKTTTLGAYNYNNNYYTGIKLPSPYCPKGPNITCLPCSTFRTSDGSCNNLNNTWWGKSETPFKRLARANYIDGVTAPATQSVVPGKVRPNARKLAMQVFPAKASVSEWTNFMTYFGQYIDHDISLTAAAIYADGFRKLCPCNSYDPDCYNIPVPYGDYANNDQTCIPFVRSLASVNAFNCDLSSREQLNVQTAYFDSSQLYGYYDKLAKQVRDPSGGGKLAVSLQQPNNLTYYEYLPRADNLSCNYDRFASEYSRRRRCYTNGDPRVEDNVVGSAIQTIFIRYHNKIASELAILEPTWLDDDIYNVARSILNAVYQNIIYAEYVPALLGPELPRRYNLLPLKRGYFDEYNPNIYTAVINEFSTAAFRYGHSVLPYSQHLATITYAVSEYYPMSYFLFNNQLYETSLDAVVRGSLVDWSYAPGPQVNAYLNDWMFNGMFWKDMHRASLAAANIQRGRDHGLASYNTYREKCYLPRAKSFDDLAGEIPADVIAKLKNLYASVDDIDLFVGAFSEFPMERAMVGPTAGCIIAKQFRDLKFGDRFYYETSNQYLRFQPSQLENIRRVTMASVLCETVDVNFLQQFPFFIANKDWNPLVDCKSVLAQNSLDITLWAGQSLPDQTCCGRYNATTGTLSAQANVVSAGGVSDQVPVTFDAAGGKIEAAEEEVQVSDLINSQRQDNQVRDENTPTLRAVKPSTAADAANNARINLRAPYEGLYEQETVNAPMTAFDKLNPSQVANNAQDEFVNHAPSMFGK